MKNMTTIRDVAQKLDLSITTVSRALDGYADVAADTRQRVIVTAQEMGYVPNRAARQLRRQKTDTIGYILPAISTGFANPFFSEFIAGLGDEASARNYDLLVSTAAPESAEEQALYQRWIQGGKVDGMILNRIRLKDWRLRYLTDQKKPLVALERSQDNLDIATIETDLSSGYIELIGHLISQGHSRIAFIGGVSGLRIEQDRLSAYRHALAVADVSADPTLVVEADLTPEGGFRAAGHLLSLGQPPSAIVCINDLTAIGAMHAAHEQGLKVGRDIAIAGFDGVADAAHTQPPLTTLDQPVYDIARQLVSMLLALINGEPLAERHVKIQPKLFIRESTGGKK